MKPSVLLLAVMVSRLLAQNAPKQAVTEFMGHKVILVEPKRDANGFAEESYQVCFDATTPKRHCYVPPAEYGPYGLSPELYTVDLGQDHAALFFSVVANFGGSGSAVNLALLHPGQHDELDDRLWFNGRLSEISGHTFWSEPSISEAPILVTADFVWGAGENHPDNHRYIVSSYMVQSNPERTTSNFIYDLADRYLTVRKYDGTFGFDRIDVLNAEKTEILARLKRVKAEREREATIPR